MAAGIRVLAASVATVAALALCAASAQATAPRDAASPRSTPAANPASIQTRAPDLVRPSTESDEVTRLLLELLAGLVVLVVIPLQVAKGVANRRREAALASARARRPRRPSRRG